MFDQPLSGEYWDLYCEDFTLHKFYSFSGTTIEALSDPYLWFSYIQDFNDPFEGQFQYRFNPSLDDILRYEYPDEEYASILKQEYTRDRSALIEKLRPKYIARYEDAIRKDRYAYCCLFREDVIRPNSNTRALSRMWSLYGDGLRGVRVNFSSALLLKSLGLVRADPINYVDTPISPDILGYFEAESVGHGPRWTHFTFSENAQNKHADWEYESEFRIRAHMRGAHPYDINAIESVDIGERMPPAQQKVIKHILAAQNQKIKFNLARVKPNSFEIETVPF